LLPPGAAHELLQLAEALTNFDDADLGELKVSRRPAAKSKAAVSKKPAQPPSGIATGYIASLQRAADDQDAFERLLDRLRADKAVKSVDLQSIANGFRGVQATYKSKTDAITAIKDFWMANNRSKSRLQRLREIF
jgi:hypothetical protein